MTTCYAHNCVATSKLSYSIELAGNLMIPLTILYIACFNGF